MKKMIKAAAFKSLELGKKKFFRNKLNAAMTAFMACLFVAGSARAEVDTTSIDGVVTDAGTWIAYGVTSFLGVLGAGLTIVAASWVYRKIKSAIRAN
ncbi:hypothetical protein EGM51_03710 [Verrucomicrobia bacterium S94]|nr:hypothetical protein EGM51_03710 [Verrucomicrobia bacterium S94]